MVEESPSAKLFTIRRDPVRCSRCHRGDGTYSRSNSRRDFCIVVIKMFSGSSTDRTVRPRQKNADPNTDAPFPE